MAEVNQDSVTYRVVCNEGGQYSLWPAFRDLPSGWSGAGPFGETPGDKADCLAWIEANWTDLTPIKPS
ncbi:MAG: MbtH family protein [Rhodospirillaceae bacterium]